MRPLPSLSSRPSFPGAAGAAASRFGAESPAAWANRDADVRVLRPSGIAASVRPVSQASYNHSVSKQAMKLDARQESEKLDKQFKKVP